MTSKQLDDIVNEPFSFKFMTQVVFRDGVWGAIFNLCKGAMGAGILAFPFAFSITGLYLGIALSIALGFMVLWSVLIMLEFQLMVPNLDSYQGLIRHFWGKRGETCCQIFLLTCFTTACIAYLCVLSDQLEGLLPEDFPFNHKEFLAIFATSCLLPLSLLPEISYLKWTSFIAVSFCFYLGFLVVSESEPGCLSKAPKANFVFSVFQAVPMIAFAFHCHGPTVSIYAGLPPVSKNRTTYTFVVICSLTCCGILYIIVGMFGSATFLEDTKPDILLNYPGDIMVLVARAGIVCSMVAGYPLNHFVAREAYIDLLRALFPSTIPGSLESASSSNVASVQNGGYQQSLNSDPNVNDSTPQKAADTRREKVLFYGATIMFYFSTLGVAVTGVQMGTLLGLIGAFGACGMIFVIPGAMLVSTHCRALAGLDTDSALSAPLMVTDEEGAMDPIYDGMNNHKSSFIHPSNISSDRSSPDVSSRSFYAPLPKNCLHQAMMSKANGYILLFLGMAFTPLGIYHTLSNAELGE
eukprot:g71243.t1